jgi:beta-glucuronidase
VGNEIDSNTPQGRSYVEGLVELGHQLDPGRPVSFASFRLFGNQERDATALTDFVLMNEYAGSWHGSKEDLPNSLDRIHALWPDRVVIISEFGLEAGWSAAAWMGDTSWMNNDSYYYVEPGTPVYSEEVFALRSQLIRDQMNVFRSRPYVAGAIFWTYRDYRSDMNFRMGLYDINHNPTSVIEVIREQYSPIRSVSLSVLESDDVISIEILPRGPIESDMPVYTLRGYKLRWSLISDDGQVLAQGERELPDLAPAEAWIGEITVDLPASEFLAEIVIIRPTGFSVGEYVFDDQGEPVR